MLALAPPCPFAASKGPASQAQAGAAAACRRRVLVAASPSLLQNPTPLAWRASLDLFLGLGPLAFVLWLGFALALTPPVPPGPFLPPHALTSSRQSDRLAAMRAGRLVEEADVKATTVPLRVVALPLPLDACAAARACASTRGYDDRTRECDERRDAEQADDMALAVLTHDGLVLCRRPH